MLTREELLAVMPKAAGVADQVTPALVAAMQRFEIEAPARRAAFLAQLAHESGQLRHWAENLNYGWQGLRKVFSKYFRTDADARAFDRQPERIANRVYGGRMGNGDEASGDGWRYRGRGPIQLTGKDNYRACGAAIGVDLVGEPARLESPDVGFLAAGWFWAKKGLNDLADAGDFEEITRRINGGLNGLADRAEFWEHAKSVFGVTQPAVVIPRGLLERMKPKRKAGPKPKPKPKRKPAGVRTGVARKKPAKAAKPRVPAKKKAVKRRSPAGKRSKVKKTVGAVVRRRSRAR